MDLRPSGHLPVPDWSRAGEVVRVMQVLTAQGEQARFVGGAVRDTLLGRAIGDIDIATTGTPERNMAALDGAGIKVLPTGVAHGTILAVVDGRGFEITTLREDIETDGRRALVRFGRDWQADAARRDLTINAIYLDPDGTYYDSFDGRADLAAGRIRFVGDPARRIAEDYLRILRFFRFWAWFGRGAADAQALAACKAAAAAQRALSGERVRTEVLALLEAADPLPAVAAMAAAGIWPPAIGAGVDVDRLAQLLAGEAEVVEQISADPLRRLGALCHGSDAAALAERLALSRAMRARLALMLAPPYAHAALAGEADLHRAVYRHGSQAVVDAALLAGDGMAAQAAAAYTVPKFPLSGRDVKAAGVEGGKRIGDLLRQVEAWWLDTGLTASRTDCLARLQDEISRAENELS